MSPDTAAAVSYVHAALRESADPDKALGMQTHKRTNMPFYGVQKPGRVPILRHLVSSYQPDTRDQYERLALALWRLPHRQEKYLAQGVRSPTEAISSPNPPPISQDDHRGSLVGLRRRGGDPPDQGARRRLPRPSLARRRPVDRRRGHVAAASSHHLAGRGQRADRLRPALFLLRRRAHEKEFFIRKATGWALREYAKTDPEAVAGFVTAYRGDLSGLSFREATKHIAALVDA